MSVIREEDIVGYLFDEMVLCPVCAVGDGHMSDLTEDMIITERSMEGAFYFCDQCKKQLG